jgi:hypothetical protein
MSQKVLRPTVFAVHRVIENILWQKVAERNELHSFSTPRRRARGRFSRRRSPSFSQPRCERIFRIALLNRVMALANRRVLQNRRECDQPIPVFTLKGVVEPMGDRLDHLNHVFKIYRDALCGAGTIVQLMRKIPVWRTLRTLLRSQSARTDWQFLRGARLLEVEFYALLDGGG